MLMPLGVLSQYIFGSLLFILSFFIIGIILLQRGRGGGLTGALGGAGGQSAFGVKAGDIFTRITAVAVLLWIFTCALACRWYRPENLSDIEANPSAVNTIGAGSAGFGDLPSSDPLNSASPPGSCSWRPPVGLKCSRTRDSSRRASSRRASSRRASIGQHTSGCNRFGTPSVRSSSRASYSCRRASTTSRLASDTREAVIHVSRRSAEQHRLSAQPLGEFS